MLQGTIKSQEALARDEQHKLVSSLKKKKKQPQEMKCNYPTSKS